jgi:predicted MPP superfamily phosphohydrolase
MNSEILDVLEKRLGRLHARQRLGIEADFEARIFGHGINFFHIENWYSIHSLIRNSLKLVGLYWRGQRNTLDIQVKLNDIQLPSLPENFNGFSILHLSDLHVDMNWDSTHALIQRVRELDYDLCVLTGDYRAKTFGPFDEALRGMALLRTHLKDPVYGVLGNHDTIQMIPGLEEMGIRMLLNESAPIERDGEVIYLAGIDDAHYYRVDNIEKSARDVPHDAVSILLSHTPEIYQQAAHAEFNVLLCGHTHGGQICLPGGFPITLDSKCPRFLGSGAWQYHRMIGYTSVGAGTCIISVRLNCPPEITLHRLRC